MLKRPTRPREALRSSARLRRLAQGVACALVPVVLQAVATDADAIRSDPFLFLHPGVTFRAADRQDLERGDVIVRLLPANDAELGVVAASRLDAPPEALITWTRRIEALKQGPFVSAIQRFSDPPTLLDLNALALDEGDLQAIRRCCSGDCDVKMAAAEIKSLRDTADSAGPAWRDAVQRVPPRGVESIERVSNRRACRVTAVRRSRQSPTAS